MKWLLALGKWWGMLCIYPTIHVHYHVIPSHITRSGELHVRTDDYTT